MRLATFITASLSLALPQSLAAQETIPGLDGTFASIACEVRPQANPDGSIGEWWLTREVTFSGDRIDATFTTYAGPGCGFALQELHFAGSVTVLGESAVADGAFEADLKIDEFVRITPLADAFADFLNAAPEGTCGENWTVGTAQDILPIGCAPLGVRPNEPTIEYEILAVQDDMVYFGARRVDGSFLTTPDLRPQALLVPARRVTP